MRWLDSGCPRPIVYPDRMKMSAIVSGTTESCGPSVIRFGDTELILRENGRHELIGGSRSDQIAAREYISFFQHEVVVNSPIRGTALGLPRLKLGSAAR